jgi:hypothetical protein
MIRVLLAFVANAFFLFANSQLPSFIVHEILLPEQVRNPENQFSGLYSNNNKLYFLPECRLQEGHSASIYVMGLNGFTKKMNDTSFTKRWQKFSIKNLDILKSKIDNSSNEYEGLEAIVVDDNTIYLSVETTTASPHCFLLKGMIKGKEVEMDTSFLTYLPKYKNEDGNPIYNAGFEAITKEGEFFYAFYEFNYFSDRNEMLVLDKFSFMGNSCTHSMPFQKLPFRITDITGKSNNHFTALNYFYKGGGADTVYRIPPTDADYNRTVNDSSQFVSYARLINVELKSNGFIWKPIWEFPKKYHLYNWEGIAAFKNGYFVINDKYSAKPNKTTLLYLAPKK